jgi:hypothetical protein
MMTLSNIVTADVNPNTGVVPSLPSAVTVMRSIEGITNETVNTSASTSSGSPVLTFLSTTGMAPGQAVSGSGVAAGSVVLSLTATQVTLTKNTTGVGNGVPIAFATPAIGTYNAIAQTAYYAVGVVFSADANRCQCTVLYSIWDSLFQTINASGLAAQGYLQSGVCKSWGVYSIQDANNVTTLNFTCHPEPLGVALSYMAFTAVPTNYSGEYLAMPAMPSYTAAFGASTFSYAIVSITIATGVVTKSTGANFSSAMVGKYYWLNGFQVKCTAYSSTSSITVKCTGGSTLPTPAQLSNLITGIPLQDEGLITLLVGPAVSRIIKKTMVATKELTGDEMADGGVPPTVLGGSGDAQFTGVATFHGTDVSYLSFSGSGIQLISPDGTKIVSVTSTGALLQGNGATGPTALVTASGAFFASAWDTTHDVPSGPASVITPSSLMFAAAWTTAGVANGACARIGSAGLIIAAGWNPTYGVPSGPAAVLTSASLTFAAAWTVGGAVSGPYTQISASGIVLATGGTSGYPVITIGTSAMTFTGYGDGTSAELDISAYALAMYASGGGLMLWLKEATTTEVCGQFSTPSGITSSQIGLFLNSSNTAGQSFVQVKDFGSGAVVQVGYQPVGSFTAGISLIGAVCWKSNLGTAASGAGTLSNLPTGKSGNPVWLAVYDTNGTLRYIPAW